MQLLMSLMSEGRSNAALVWVPTAGLGLVTEWARWGEESALGLVAETMRVLE